MIFGPAALSAECAPLRGCDAAELLSEQLGPILSLKADLKTDTAVLGNWLKRSRLDLAVIQPRADLRHCLGQCRSEGLFNPDHERGFNRQIASRYHSDRADGAFIQRPESYPVPGQRPRREVVAPG